MRDSRGTGFRHKTYFVRGGMEAIYDDMNPTLGFAGFAPMYAAEAAMFSARQRLRGKEQNAG